VASIIAINADTGVLKWHYQCTPGDQWDYDAIQHLVLAISESTTATARSSCKRTRMATSM
jgi:glucose dehydrogenase